MSEITGRNVGKTCRTHYKGTFNDGTQFDSSYDRGEPLEFVCGAGQMIKGFDAAVADMEVGEMKEIHLMPEEAYGMPDPNAILELEIAKLPGSEELEVGQQVYLTNQMGQPFPVKVIAKDEVNITFDANHEMAGKEHDLGKSCFLQHDRRLVENRKGQVLDDAVLFDVAEQCDLAENGRIVHRTVTARYDDIRHDTKGLQLFNRMLRRF